MTEKPKPRGLAAMSKEKRKAIASLGGSKSGANFKNRTPEQRRAAGSKGGKVSRRVYERP